MSGFKEDRKEGKINNRQTRRSHKGLTDNEIEQGKEQDKRN